MKLSEQSTTNIFIVHSMKSYDRTKILRVNHAQIKVINDAQQC